MESKRPFAREIKLCLPLKEVTFLFFSALKAGASSRGDFETRCESLQQDLEDVQVVLRGCFWDVEADKQAIVESNQFELQELAMRQDFSGLK